MNGRRNGAGLALPTHVAQQQQQRHPLFGHRYQIVRPAEGVTRVAAVLEDGQIIARIVAPRDDFGVILHVPGGGAAFTGEDVAMTHLRRLLIGDMGMVEAVEPTGVPA